MSEYSFIQEDSELINNFCAGFESLLDTRHSPKQFVGNEGVCYWLMKASDLETHSGKENFLIDGIKKFWDMIVNSLKAVKNFFFGDNKKKTEKAIDSLNKPSAPIFKKPSERSSVRIPNSFSGINTDGYTPNGPLKSSADGDDISSIRIALFLEMNDKRVSTSEMIKTFAWVLSKHPNLFVPYKEDAYSQAMNDDQSKWNKDYYHMQKVYASGNFSLKRIRHMLAVRDKVFDLPESEDVAQSKEDNKSDPAIKPTEHLVNYVYSVPGEEYYLFGEDTVSLLTGKDFVDSNFTFNKAAKELTDIVKSAIKARDTVSNLIGKNYEKSKVRNKDYYTLTISEKTNQDIFKFVSKHYKEVSSEYEKFTTLWGNGALDKVKEINKNVAGSDEAKLKKENRLCKDIHGTQHIVGDYLKSLMKYITDLAKINSDYE